MTRCVESNKKIPTTKGWTPLLLFVSIATTFGTAIPVGYILGVTNTPAEFIKSWCAESLITRYDLHFDSSQIDVLFSMIVSIFLIGGIIGSFFGAWCCDKVGRKGCLNVSATILIIGGFCFNFCREANSVEMLLLGRFLCGLAAALIYTAHPMYLVEIAPSQLRGTVGVFTAVGVTGGICLGQLISLPQVFGTESLWHYALSSYAALVMICFSPSYWYPESPSWLLLVKDNQKAARFELERIRGKGSSTEMIDYEMLEIEKSSAKCEEKSSFGSLLRNKEYLLPLVIVCSFQACQQLSGINAIFFYSVQIFTKAGFSVATASWMNLGAGFLNLLFSLLGPLLMAHCNRRPLMMFSCLGCCVAQLGVSFTLKFIDAVDWFPMACISFMAIFIIIFQFGLGPIPYFIASELFEITPRPAAMSLGSLFSWTSNFIIGMFFPMLQNLLGPLAFLPCSVICVYGFALTWRFLPESRNRDPSDLKPLMKDGFKSKVF